MKKIFLLLLLSILFVSCTERAMDENANTRDTTNFNTSDTSMLPEEGSNPMLLPNAETPAVTEGKITMDDAKRIAFEDAGVNESDVTGLDTDTDREGSRRYYEIDFKTGGYEYEYDIDMESGKILKKDKEID